MAWPLTFLVLLVFSGLAFLLGVAVGSDLTRARLIRQLKQQALERERAA